MKRVHWMLLAGAVAATILAAGYFAYAPQQSSPESVADSNAPSVDALFAASYPDLAGRGQPLAQWRGKVLVVNFWAAWCPPCRTEIPDFIRMQDKYGKDGLQFVGIALDRKDAVQAFADEIGINYPVLLGEESAAEVARLAGNRLSGLPYTVVIDRQGRVVAGKIGGATLAELEPIVRPLL